MHCFCASDHCGLTTAREQAMLGFPACQYWTLQTKQGFWVMAYFSYLQALESESRY